jgi:hypothetical protein
MALDLPIWGHISGHGFGALDPGILDPTRQRRYFAPMTAKEQLCLVVAPIGIDGQSDPNISGVAFDLISS